MAADLHIHVYLGLDESDLKDFLCVVPGSKYFSMLAAVKVQRSGKWEKAFERIGATPNVWVGEVSWLKAAVTGDADAYVPAPVRAVFDIIGEDLPVIDDALIERIRAALDIETTLPYAVAKAEDVVAFLEKYRGRQVFTVSW